MEAMLLAWLRLSAVISKEGREREGGSLASVFSWMEGRKRLFGNEEREKDVEKERARNKARSCSEKLRRKCQRSKTFCKVRFRKLGPTGQFDRSFKVRRM